MKTRIFSFAAVVAALFALAACGPGNNAPSGGGNDGGTNSGGNEVAKDNDNDNQGEPEENEGDDAFDIEAARKAQIDKAWAFLKKEYNKPPSPDDPKGLLSGWGPKSMNVPYTGFVVSGLVGTHVWKSDDPMIKDSVEWLVSVQEPSGGWSYIPGDERFKGIRAVYITSVLAQLLGELNKLDAWKGKLDTNIGNAVDYLKQAQVGNPEGPAADYSKESVGFGGWAYSKEELPKSVGEQGKPAANMSTSTFAIDALHACGLSKDDPLWKDALIFLKRNQNAGEVQDEGFTAMHDGMKVKPAGEGSPDYGGAIYSEETSKASTRTENEDGTVTLHSYGSMTYNLLRAYLFAGLKKDSIPVKLAWGWIQRNYTVERVPGYRDEGQYDMGLYYYYLSMAKTLHALDVDVVEEPERGLKHNWREDLVKEFGERQKEDGSWINENHSRWQEDSKVLTTGYVLNALKHTRK